MLIDGHHLSFKSLSELEYILKVFNIYKYIKKLKHALNCIFELPRWVGRPSIKYVVGKY